MLSNSRSRRIAMGAALILILTLVAPAAATPPDNPFVGSWETIYVHDLPGLDESHIRYQIGGSGHYHTRVDATLGCLVLYGEAWPSSGSGWGEVTGDDPYVFAADLALYCHTDEGRQIVYESFHIELQYDPATDTIFALHYPQTALFNCAWRSGSDASVCP